MMDRTMFGGYVRDILKNIAFPFYAVKLFKVPLASGSLPETPLCGFPAPGSCIFKTMSANERY